MKNLTSNINEILKHKKFLFHCFSKFHATVNRGVKVLVLILFDRYLFLFNRFKTIVALILHSRSILPDVIHSTNAQIITINQLGHSYICYLLM